jgi:hypothetical protein
MQHDPPGLPSAPPTDVRIDRAAVHPPEVWRAALESGAWLSGATPVKAEGRAWALRARLLGMDVLVKAQALTLRRRLQRLASATPFHRHWDGARWLERQAIATPRPLCLARGHLAGTPGGHPGGATLLLVTQWLPGLTLLQWLRDGAGRQAGGRVAEEAVGAAAGRLVARILGAGRYNRDHKPSNLLITRLDEQGCELAVLDCADLRPLRPIGLFHAACRMMASMVIEPTGCGCAPGNVLCRRALRGYLHAAWTGPHPDPRDEEPVDPAWEHGSARMFWRLTAARVAAHREPRPRTPPSDPGATDHRARAAPGEWRIGAPGTTLRP